MNFCEVNPRVATIRSRRGRLPATAVLPPSPTEEYHRPALLLHAAVKPVGCLIFGNFKLCCCEDYCTFLLLHNYRRRTTGLKCIRSFNTLEANAYCLFQDSCRTLPSYQELMKVVFNFSYSGGYVMFSCCSFTLHFSDD